MLMPLIAPGIALTTSRFRPSTLAAFFIIPRVRAEMGCVNIAKLLRGHSFGPSGKAHQRRAACSRSLLDALLSSLSPLLVLPCSLPGKRFVLPTFCRSRIAIGCEIISKTNTPKSEFPPEILQTSGRADARAAGLIKMSFRVYGHDSMDLKFVAAKNSEDELREGDCS